MKRFVCNFGKGFSCEAHVTDKPPSVGQPHILKMLWLGRGGKRHIRPYINWVNSFHKTLADEWGIKIMYVFEDCGKVFEVWQYEPGKKPKKVEL